MKKLIYSAKESIKAGRDSRKSYSDLKFTNWTRTKTDIMKQINMYIDNPDKARLDDLKRSVRYSISEAEDAADRLQEYVNVLDKFNSSSASESDCKNLLADLKKFHFQVSESTSVAASSKTNYKKFIKDHFYDVLDYINDTTDLYGDDFRDACIDDMIDRMKEANISFPEDIESYLADMYDGYGEE